MCKEAKLGLAAGVIFLLMIGIGSKNPSTESQDPEKNPVSEKIVSQSQEKPEVKSAFQTTSRENSKHNGPTLE